MAEINRDINTIERSFSDDRATHRRELVRERRAEAGPGEDGRKPATRGGDPTVQAPAARPAGDGEAPAAPERAQDQSER